MIWNMYEFFTMYAEVDGWTWGGELKDPYGELINTLDRWIVSRVHQLLESVDNSMKTYNIPLATKDILPFVDDASNWYVRRSRKRFWKSDNDQDKQDAYKVLHYVLVCLSYVLAPFTPFMAEELFIKLTRGKSIHLRDWPQVGHVDELLVEKMTRIREVITQGLNQRALAGIKVRQPLGDVNISSRLNIDEEFYDIIKEELNVKKVMLNNGVEAVEINTTITESLKQEGLMRDIVRHIQECRKKSAFKVDDRINLKLVTEDKALARVVENYRSTIYNETLAVNHHVSFTPHTYSVKLGDASLEIRLEKASD
jgi:isoleucyl-tRNA synthetase